jgi:hypothetical protein
VKSSAAQPLSDSAAELSRKTKRPWRSRAFDLLSLQQRVAPRAAYFFFFAAFFLAGAFLAAFLVAYFID